VLNHVVYDAFGGVTTQTDESVVFRYGYTAREFDAESGLQYNRARYLDSFTGKFISEDPIGFGGGDVNLSRYVGNSPIKYTDPLGLFELDFKKEFKKIFGFGDPGRNSGLPPYQPRMDSNDEEQRVRAIQIVKDYAQKICETAKKYNVTPDAIAGAILWEGIENPYPRHRIFRDNIPGKIHPYVGDVAESVEMEGRVPPLVQYRGIPNLARQREFFDQFGRLSRQDLADIRETRLADPNLAITYIGAILDRSAEFYEKLPIGKAAIDGINIRNQAGILGALYQGGDPERRSQDFLNRRLAAPNFLNRTFAIPGPLPKLPDKKPDNESLGPWVSQYRDWIHKSFFQNCSYSCKNS
jgi:RHS repeat-associated protein